MLSCSRVVTIGALSVVIVGVIACSSSSSDTASGGAPVIENVQVSGDAKKAADGKYDATLRVTAHDDGTIVSARIDFSSDEPASLVGTEVQVNKQTLTSASITFRLDASAGPGTGDANLVLTDNAGNVAKKKIIVTMRDDGVTAGADAGTDAGGTSTNCSSEQLPKAPATCTIAGTYAASAEVSCPNNCNETGYEGLSYKVTESAGKATFDNGNPTSPVKFSCTLSGCTCTASNGDVYIFTATGFAGTTVVNRGSGGCVYTWLEKGVRQ